MSSGNRMKTQLAALSSLTLLLPFSACDTKPAMRPIDAIVTNLLAADHIGRQKFAVELRRHAAAAVPAWVDLLENDRDDYNLHVIAAGELGSLGVEAKAAVPALIRFVRDGFPGMKPPELAVEERFKTRDVARMPAIEALKQIGAPAVEPVRQLLGHDLGRVRQEAALILGNLRAGSAIADLVRGLDDTDKAAATAAAWALGEIQSATPEVLAALRRAFDNVEPLVRFEALKSVGKLGEGAVSLREAVRKMTGDPNPGVRRTAVLVLQQLPASDSPPEKSPPDKGQPDKGQPGKSAAGADDASGKK